MHGDVQKVEHDRSDELTRFSGRSGLAMIAVVIGLVLVASGCGTTPHQASLALATFAGHGSIEEAYVIGAPPGKRLNVLDASGKKVGSGVVDNLGGLIVTNLTPGPGFRFEYVSGGKTEATPPFSVLSTVSDPNLPIYSSQHLHARSQLRDDARRRSACRNGPPTSRKDAGGRAFSDGHRVLRICRGRAAQPHKRARRQGVEQGPAAPRHRNDRRIGDRSAAWIRDRERPDARHGLLGRSIRLARVAVRLRRLRHHPDRRLPSPGCSTTRSAWSVSRTRESRNWWSPGPTPPTSPRSHL